MKKSEDAGFTSGKKRDRPKPMLEGQFHDPVEVMEDSTRHVDSSYPKTRAYIDAINQAFAEYRAYHETLLEKAISGKGAKDALKEFDQEVNRINKLSAARSRMLRQAAKNRRDEQRTKLRVLQSDTQGGGDTTTNPCANAETKIIMKKPQQIVRQYPKTSQPESITLPFVQKNEDWHGKGIAWQDTHQKVATLQVGNRKLQAPGWLMDLNKDQIKKAYQIKEYLNDLLPTEDITKTVNELHSLVAELGLGGIAKSEITRVLRWLPVGKESGLDYRIFFLALGDFAYASNRNTIRPYPRRFQCPDELDDSELYTAEFDAKIEKLFQPVNDYDSFFEVSKKPPSKRKLEPPPYPLRGPGEYVPTKERKEMHEWRKRIVEAKEKELEQEAKEAEQTYNERLEFAANQRESYSKDLKEKRIREEEAKKKEKLEKERKEKIVKNYKEELIKKGVPPLTAAKKARTHLLRLESQKELKARSEDLNEYSPRQKLLWTSLFFTEMYEAMDVVEALANNSNAVIPHRVAPKEEDLYRIWKENQIEKQRLSKETSPYLSPISVVSTRLVKEYPKACLSQKTMDRCDKSLYRSKVAFDHWLIDVPKNGEGRLTITENRYRTRQILDYAFFKDGSALSQLPKVEMLLHFAHNLVDQLMGREDKEIPPGENKRKTGSATVSVSQSSATIVKGSTTNVAKPQESKEEVRSKSAPPSSATGPSFSATQSKNRPKTSSSQTKVKDEAPFLNPETIKAAKEAELDPCKLANPPLRKNICKKGEYKKPELPPRFKGTEGSWVRKFTEQLYRPTHPNKFHPTEPIVSYGKVDTLRKKLENLHSKEWDSYNCRRFHFRKELWENMDVGAIRSKVGRDRFATAFWSLLPHENRLPLGLVNSNVEMALR